MRLTLIRSSLVFGVLTTAGVFALLVAVFSVRLLPWLFAPEVPLGVSAPFARALAVRALEGAVILGLPIGFALAAARFTERGEARALYALGVSPWALVGRLAVPACVISATYFAWAATRHESPGRFASELLAEGRASCEGARTVRSVEVPLTGITWLCFPPRPPIATGRVPGLGAKGRFTATALSPSSDMTRFAVTGLNLSFPARESPPLELRLRAREATIGGLPAWGRPATLAVTARSALSALSAWGLGLGAAALVLAHAVTSRLLALCLASGASLLMLGLTSMLDGLAHFPPTAYAAAPAVALLFLTLCGAVLRRGRKWGGRSRYFRHGVIARKAGG